ncbi:Envelope biogenesis factor ElyC [Nymphon striatum]|nr:Envelope biogenesis factor ElyC [Nymphon striatum]
MTLTMLAWTFTWSQTDPEGVQPADAIVCLGAGMGPNGGLDPAARRRVARCVDLHRAGVAPNIVFSGGTARSDGPSAGHQMGLYAQTLGLPGNAIIEEGRAQSTLQNALFSLELIPDADRLVIVTEAFHLPRAWASFKWAAYELNMEAPVFILDMSEQVRQHPNRAGVSWNLLGRESIAICGADPDWAMSITEDGTLFEYGQAVDTELDIAWETPAEGAAWPRVLTLLGRGTSAIVILEQPRDATYPIRILTQRGETPLLLVGGCSEF